MEACNYCSQELSWTAGSPVPGGRLFLGRFAGSTVISSNGFLKRHSGNGNYQRLFFLVTRFVLFDNKMGTQFSPAFI